jgi:hypothetical protein
MREISQMKVMKGTRLGTDWDTQRNRRHKTQQQTVLIRFGIGPFCLVDHQPGPVPTEGEPQLSNVFLVQVADSKSDSCAALPDMDGTTPYLDGTL